jgi:hypothetical protein
MRKLLFLTALSFTFCQSAFTLPMIEVTFGYLFFGNNKARNVYDRGGESVSFAALYPVYDIWHIYGSVGYWERNGRTLDLTADKMRLEAYPISLGIKPVMTLSQHVDCYFNFEPRYFFLHEHNGCPIDNKDVNKGVLGGYVGTGFIFIPCMGCTFDIFAEYSYLGTKIPCGCDGSHFISDLSCISGGAGIGISF